MTARSDLRRAIVGSIVGLLYGSVLALWSLVLFGGGHATSIPLFLSSAPLGAFFVVGKLFGEPYLGYGYNAALLGGPLVWAVLGLLVAQSGRAKTVAQVLLLLHYASGLALLTTTAEEATRLRLPGVWSVFVMWAMVYLAGQVALWSWIKAGSEWRRAIVGAIVGLVYGSTLMFLSIGAVGGGHGTSIPLFLSSAPLSAFYLVADADAGREAALFAMLFSAPFLWAALGLLVALSGRRKRLTQVLVLLHYASGLALIAITVGWRAWPADLKRAPELVVAWATVYLVGQMALWWRMSRPAPQQPSLPQSS